MHKISTTELIYTLCSLRYVCALYVVDNVLLVLRQGFAPWYSPHQGDALLIRRAKHIVSTKKWSQRRGLALALDETESTYGTYYFPSQTFICSLGVCFFCYRNIVCLSYAGWARFDDYFHILALLAEASLNLGWLESAALSQTPSQGVMLLLHHSHQISQPTYNSDLYVRASKTADRLNFSFVSVGVFN